MVPDKFNMVDMGGIDLIMMQGEEVPGLYDRLVESITQCSYQCLYNWLFDGIIIPPSYVKMEVNENDEVVINEGVTVSQDDVIHIYSLEVVIEPTIESLSITENGTYTVEEGVDGFDPVVVDVPIPEPVTTTITITENGTYTPETGVDGFSEVVVDVETVPPSPLPDTYQQVEYISCEGAQWTSAIGINILIGDYIRILCRTTASNGENCVIGWSGTGGSTFECYTNGTAVEATAYGSVELPWYIDTGAGFNLYNKDQLMVFKVTSNLALAIIGRYRESGNQYPYNGRIYRITVSDSVSTLYTDIGTAKYDWIPCYRKSDNLAGLYDIINGVFYYSSSGTDFIAGPDV